MKRHAHFDDLNVCYMLVHRSIISLASLASEW